MIREQNTSIYRFDDFEIDRANRQFRKAGEPVNLPAKAFDLLVELVENRGQLVKKDELFESVWHGQIVEESNLTVYISQIRKALGESKRDPRYIETVPGYGYRFVGKLDEQAEDEYVIETRTLSRITIENGEMPEGVGFAGQMLLPDASRNSQRSFVRWAGFLIRAAVVLAGGYFAYTRYGRQDSSFADANIKRLTNKGTINWAIISPDGKFFAYTANNDKNDFKLGLWLAQTDGSNEVQVRPPEPGIYRGLAFSHDSKALYFAHNTRDQSYNGTLYRMPVLGGVPEKLLDQVGEFLSLSPDDRQIAYFRMDKERKVSALVIANIDGSGERELTTRPFNLAFSSKAPAWSSDGATLATAAINESRDEEIFLVDAATGESRPVKPNGWRDILNIVWQAENKGLIAIAKEKGSADNQIWQIDATSGEARRISRDADTYGAPLSISLDSQSLLVTQALTEGNIWVAQVDDLANAKQITFSSIGAMYGWLGIDWSPDGKIYFIGAKDKSRVIYSMDADGGNVRQITPDGGIDQKLNVSLDGSFIVFQSNRGGTNEIWRSTVDGSDMRQLTSGGMNGSPSISPDGQWIAYVSGRYGKTSIWRVSANGGEPIQVTERAAFSPRISPDGILISCFLMSDNENLHRLALFPATGGEPVKLFSVARSANLSQEWSRDGKSVFYRDWISGVWNQAIAGGEPTKVPGLPESEILPFS
ncbi:MAG TPA: winged helix-turn-helix domain-containing protein [Pyrinomonadaceae bacterium]|nr:winged helix-turn-helix domain-containing protein [Pyrinomonadaceae bacterium]